MQVSASGGDPGSMTVMSRAVCEALFVTVTGTSSWVADTTDDVPAVTLSPEMNTAGVAANPLPVSCTMPVVPRPMTAGEAPVMGAPGAVMS